MISDEIEMIIHEQMGAVELIELSDDNSCWTLFYLDPDKNSRCTYSSSSNNQNLDDLMI